LICSSCPKILVVQSIEGSVGCIFYSWGDVTYLRNREIQTRKWRKMSVLKVVHETNTLTKRDLLTRRR